MVQPVARGTQAQEQEEKVKASKQAIRDFLITYQSMFPELQLTGNFNINSAIKSLENNVYFADKPEVIKQLQDAALQGDIDSIKSIFDSTVQQVDFAGVDLPSIEGEQGITLPPEQQEALENTLVSFNRALQDGTIGAIAQQYGMNTVGKDNETILDELKTFVINNTFAIDPQSGTRLVPTGEGQLQVSQGYFNNVLHSHILAMNSTYSEKIAFQKYLIDHNIATEEDFAGTLGQYSEVLRQKIEEVMLWADQNINAGPGTATRADIMSKEPIFFADVQYQDMDISFERNLFAYAVQEIGRQNIELDKLELDKALEAEAIKYIPPSPENLETMVDAYFVANIGRSATAGELSEWSSALASSYDEGYAQYKSFQYALDNFDLKETTTINPGQGGGLDVGTQVTTTTNLSELSSQLPSSPQEIFEGKFEDAMEDEMSAFEKGKTIKDMQNKIMSAQFGA